MSVLGPLLVYLGGLCLLVIFGRLGYFILRELTQRGGSSAGGDVDGAVDGESDAGWPTAGATVEQSCRRHGWRYEPTNEDLARLWTGRLPGAVEFTLAEHVIHARLGGREVTLFELVVAADLFRPAALRGRRHTACVMALPVELPVLEVTRRRSADARPDTGVLKLDDPDFERRFRVRALDPDWVAAVLDSNAREALLNMPLRLSWRVDGAFLVGTWSGSFDSEIDSVLESGTDQFGTDEFMLDTERDVVAEIVTARVAMLRQVADHVIWAAGAR